MSHLTRSSTNRARNRRPLQALGVLSAAALAAGCLAYAVVSTTRTAPRAHGAGRCKPARRASRASRASRPRDSDVGNVGNAGDGGAAGPGRMEHRLQGRLRRPGRFVPAKANWFYDIGTGYGTGEIEQTTSSTRNVSLDGHGHLVLKAIRAGGSWTSARIESTRDDFQAPAGGELEMTASIKQPDPADGLGYWPAFWALGSPMRRAAAGRRPASST